MPTLSPEDRYQVLVNKLGVDDLMSRIKALQAQGKAHSRLSAVDRIFQEFQWETLEGGAQLRGFYLGTYKRGPPGIEWTETYLLTEHQVEILRPEEPEFFAGLDELPEHGVLAPVELGPVDRVQNLASGEKLVRMRGDETKVKRINLPGALIAEWANSPEDIANTARPVLAVEAISAVRDVVPPQAWTTTPEGKRQRDPTVPTLPIITKDGDINLRLTLGEGASRISVGVSDPEQLIGLLEPGDTDDPHGWFNWIQENALKAHDDVLKELRAFAGRRVVVFGSGGSEIERRDPETSQREVIQLGTSFVSAKQFGFLMSFGNAARRAHELAQGETVIAARPSAAALTPGQQVVGKVVEVKPAADAILELVASGGATKEGVKKLARIYDAETLVGAVNDLMNANAIKYDRQAGKYVKAG